MGTTLKTCRSCPTKPRRAGTSVAVHGFRGSRLRSCPRTPFWRRIYVRNARLRHSQSESWRRIGKYVAKPAFFTRTSGLLFLSLSLTLNVEPGTCERLRTSFRSKMKIDIRAKEILPLWAYPKKYLSLRFLSNTLRTCFFHPGYTYVHCLPRCRCFPSKSPAQKA